MTLTNVASANGTDAVADASARNTTRPAREGKLDKKHAAETASRGSEKSATAASKNKSKTKSKSISPTTETKAAVVLKKLSSPKGVTIDALMEATGWQAHSVRGFLSAVVRKKLGLNLVSEIGKDGVRWYRIDDAGKAG